MNMPEAPPKKPLISPEYAELNRAMHAQQPVYGAAAAKDAAGLVKYARKENCRTILDYGCGKGSLKPAIAAIAPDFIVYEYDPAVPGKERLPSHQVDLIAAMDVMEHIEPELLDAVLESMVALRPKLVILKIALTPAQKTLPDGRNAHILLRPSAWWAEQLAGYFTAQKAKELPLHFLFIGHPL
jgi:2-polyprenyl-3-methyl-5-hydroxy-6-metoxy-1,4-benzoquinol methylase